MAEVVPGGTIPLGPLDHLVLHNQIVAEALVALELADALEAEVVLEQMEGLAEIVALVVMVVMDYKIFIELGLMFTTVVEAVVVRTGSGPLAAVVLAVVLLVRRLGTVAVALQIQVVAVVAVDRMKAMSVVAVDQGLS